MKRTILLTAVVCLAAAASIASAELVQGISIDLVTIGNPGNAGDTRGYGAVSYEYRIGKYEVTNAQWYDFVAAAGAPTGNDGHSYPGDAYDKSAYWTGDNTPTTHISWYEAAQFCNYLSSGDKSQGAYRFSGDNSNPGDFEGIDRDLAVSTYGIVYVIPTEDEWHKAAYFTGSGYSTYANGTDTAPIAGVDTNYGQDYPDYDGPWEVGVGNGTEEQNGTFDMMGNVLEWNETLSYYSSRLARGGSYGDSPPLILSSSARAWRDPGLEYLTIGFRVAEVPEPATLLLLGLGGLGLVRRRKGV